ncbi:hypothetical protein [Methylobacterium sp. WL9]|uniref:hypothetical protein n=1 Tax=Methylobacterium sp. WL9 TaxID=2603898 RepID=UPI0011D612EB|nr:hypothetical protein [Methylobacterium sp. WL9]TXN24582.1 hypothetical protein FV217_01980 [Methylobacterium sp. WL9]
MRLPHAQQADPSDRGIGGTGVIGTIRRFGSIVVNDLRIGYPHDVAVRIDGAPARAAASAMQAADAERAALRSPSYRSPSVREIRGSAGHIRRSGVL